MIFQQEMATPVEHGKALNGELNDFKGKLNKLQTEFKILICDFIYIFRILCSFIFCNF